MTITNEPPMSVGNAKQLPPSNAATTVWIMARLGFWIAATFACGVLMGMHRASGNYWGFWFAAVMAVWSVVGFLRTRADQRRYMPWSVR